MSGCLVVISGPSGVGKSSVIQKVRAAYPSLQFSVSATTREIRPNEVDGKDYYFVSHDEFEAMIAQGALLEYSTYVDNYYGTPIQPIRDALENGGDMLLDIEPNGARNVKKIFPDAVLIYLAPPSMEELERRLRARGDTPEKVIRERLKRARWEAEQMQYYDYVVVNDKLDIAADQVIQILSGKI